MYRGVLAAWALGHRRLPLRNGINACLNGLGVAAQCCTGSSSPPRGWAPASNHRSHREQGAKSPRLLAISQRPPQDPSSILPRRASYAAISSAGWLSSCPRGGGEYRGLPRLLSPLAPPLPPIVLLAPSSLSAPCSGSRACL